MWKRRKINELKKKKVIERKWIEEWEKARNEIRKKERKKERKNERKVFEEWEK